MCVKIRLEDFSKSKLIKIVLKKDKEIEEKDKEIENLKKELHKYKNSNTPSSANKHLQPNTQGAQASGTGKRGAPKGHRGTTRNQTPDKKEVINACNCPRCNGSNLKDNKIIKQTIEEIPEPVVPETTAHEIHKKECLDCGLKFIPPQNTVPLKGKFGINIMVLVIFIKFILRGVLRKSALFLGNHFMLKLAPASVNAIIKRVSEAAEKEYESLKTEIRNSTKAYVDETSFSVLGKKWWVWVFRNDTTRLLVIRPGRGSNVLDEILGKAYSGTVICDCWGAYNFLEFASLQRCWSHLLRKSKELIDTVPGKHFHEKLKVLFEEIKVFNESNPTQQQREKKYVIMTSELQKLLKYYSKYPKLTKVIKYIGRKTDQWFTCIRIEGIEPTNNFAEQAIRETVMVRKIIGAFRSEDGVGVYETLASLMATWQMRELDLKAELKRMLVKNLCFC